MVDATDLKSVSHIESEGSSPSTPISFYGSRYRDYCDRMLYVNTLFVIGNKLMSL